MKKSDRDQRFQLPSVNSSRSFYYSVLLHVAIVLVFIIGLDWGSTPAPLPPGESKVMNAKAVDPRAVEQEMQKLKAAEQAKQQEADRKVADAEKRRLQEERKLEQLKAEKETLKQQKEAENRRLEEETQRLAEEKEQITAQKLKEEQAAKQIEAQKKQAIMEKEKLEKEKKQLAEEARKADEARKKQQAEAAKQKAAEDKKQAEADKKRKAEEAKRQAEEKRKAEEAKALADAMAEEEAELAAAAQARADQSELAKYTAAILRQVTGNFVAPNISSGLKCTLLVRMIPGGQVVEAKVIKSSGDPTFDRQAELAVRKASPLPVPEEPRLFQQMKDIQFEFDPSGAM